MIMRRIDGLDRNFMLRLTDDDFDALHAIAWYRRQSASDVIREWIRKAYERLPAEEMRKYKGRE